MATDDRNRRVVSVVLVRDGGEPVLFVCVCARVRGRRSPRVLLSKAAPDLATTRDADAWQLYFRFALAKSKLVCVHVMIRTAGCFGRIGFDLDLQLRCMRVPMRTCHWLHTVARNR